MQKNGPGTNPFSIPFLRPLHRNVHPQGTDWFVRLCAVVCTARRNTPAERPVYARKLCISPSSATNPSHKPFSRTCQSCTSSRYEPADQRPSRGTDNSRHCHTLELSSQSKLPSGIRRLFSNEVSRGLPPASIYEWLRGSYGRDPEME